MDVKLPDGTIINNVPEGTTKADLMAKLQSNGLNLPKITAPVAEQPANYTLSESLQSGLENFIPSTINVAKGVAQSVIHPAKTMEGLIQATSGAISKALPESVMKYAIPEKRQAAEQVASAVAKDYADKYGSYEGFKRAIAENPAGVLADISTVAGGGGALLKGAEEGSKAAKLASVLNKTSNVTNPLLAVEKTVTAIPNVGGIVAKNIVGTTTGTSADTLQNAYEAGKTGNKAFMANLTGKANMEDVLNQAKSALNNIKQTKSQDYARNMEAVKSDQSVLNMQPIIDALNKEKTAGTFGEKVIKKNTVKTQTELEGLIQDWASSDPAKYHTPEGLDALKQAVGDLRDSTEIGTNSRRIVDNVYHAVKDQISTQAPVYEKTMKDYSEASNLVKEIERSLSLGNKSSADTAMRKLQSLTRNNVQTNYGQRIKLAEELAKKGGQDIMPALSGQALNEWFPRGMIGKGEELAGLIAAFTHPQALLAAPLASPKIMGATTYGLGKVAGAGAKLGNKIPLSVDQANKLGLLLYQMNQNKEQQ